MSNETIDLFHPALDFLAALQRPPSYYKVLWAACEHLDSSRWRVLSARRAAEVARISRASAERALALLEADRVNLARGRASAKERRLSRTYCSTTGPERWLREPTDPDLIDSLRPWRRLPAL